MYGSARLHPGFPGVRAHARETGQWVSREDLLCLPAAQQTNGQLLVQTKGKENLHENLGPTGATERVRLLASYPSSYFFFLTWSYQGPWPKTSHLTPIIPLHDDIQGRTGPNIRRLFSWRRVHLRTWD